MNLLLERIETKRLLLVPADTKYAYEIYSNFDIETTKYMYPKPADNINETLDFLNNSICEMRKGTNFQLIIIEKETEEFVGCAGFHDLDNEVPELGIWIKREKFGKKYGQEAIKGIVNWAVKQNKWKKAKYPVDKRNISSRKIPESLNGIIVKEYKEKNMNGIELDEVEYEVSLEKEFA